ncbi:universal stress protein [Halopiger goleimassiliensis]|uniref:universal stress protein n=1 Tax=Halopiger goleimassiliensis TaxID=1293048 RepID=UPI000677626D|nr:universal stress protein [Halopiger goleimassiliensis]
MYTLLVPAKSDRSLEVVDYVTGLPAADTAVEVIVCNVFEEFEVADDTVVRSDDVYDDTELPDSVRDVADALDAADVDVTVRREHGDPIEEILTIADEADVDEIVMVSRQRSPTGKAVFGSTTQQVLLETERPVTVLTSE